MSITYLIVSLVIGVFMSYVWSSKDLPNLFIKMVAILYTIWTFLLLTGASWNYILTAIPNARLF